MLKFYRILLLTLVAVFLASTAGIARYAADSEYYSPVLNPAVSIDELGPHRADAPPRRLPRHKGEAPRFEELRVVV